ncbi:MAG: type II secretion system minor pseudopilin GspJ [Pseudomonadota bacterium]
MTAVRPLACAGPAGGGRTAPGRGQRGVTLVELLVALMIFTFIAAVAAYTIRLSVDARTLLEKAEAQTRDFEAFRVRMKQDLAQIVPRPVRNEFGAATAIWFYGGAAHPIDFGDRQAGASERLLASFVRDGWINPQAEEPRASLQFVQYLVRDGALIRRTRPYLDDARGLADVERVMMTGLTAVDMRFLRGEAAGRFDWVVDWPPSDAPLTPRAVEVTLEGPAFGAVRLAFLASGAAP